MCTTIVAHRTKKNCVSSVSSNWSTENMSAGENNCYRAFDVRLISQIFLIAQYSICEMLFGMCVRLSGKQYQ